jgi:hypothetical protein
MRLIVEWRDGLELHRGRVVGYAPIINGGISAIVLEIDRLLHIPLRELIVIESPERAKRHIKRG